MPQVHPPKRETIDLDRGINIDPKGIARDIEASSRTADGLRIARPTPGRAQFCFLESWLVPRLGLRITDFWFNPGYLRDQDFYLDVVAIDGDEHRWQSTDLYLDIVLRDGQDAQVIDTDELLAAHSAGLIDDALAQRALQITYRALQGLAANGHHLHAWMASLGIELTWLRR